MDKKFLIEQLDEGINLLEKEVIIKKIILDKDMIKNIIVWVNFSNFFKISELFKEYTIDMIKLGLNYIDLLKEEDHLFNKKIKKIEFIIENNEEEIIKLLFQEFGKEEILYNSLINGRINGIKNINMVDEYLLQYVKYQIENFKMIDTTSLRKIYNYIEPLTKEYQKIFKHTIFIFLFLLIIFFISYIYI